MIIGRDDVCISSKGECIEKSKKKYLSCKKKSVKHKNSYCLGIIKSKIWQGIVFNILKLKVPTMDIETKRSGLLVNLTIIVEPA